ncbi:MAG: phosphoglyceromutase [Acidobacteriota bacterium]|nr:phosphoglyceromutase [Acidobacteriota bacterium]
MARFRRTAVLMLLCAPFVHAQRKPTHIILVTADGLRWQDVFHGIDESLMKEKSAGMQDAAAVRDRLWKATPEERRKALMPFFWNTLVPSGILLGNATRNSEMRVTNRYRVSYPGYSEILTGRAQDDVIRGNDKIQNPLPTLLDTLRDKWKLRPRDVALFASWDVFTFIGTQKPGSVTINAGYSKLELPMPSARMAALNEEQFRATTPWESARHDYFTFALGFEYLKTARPRALYLAFDETDDWAHDHRYDKVLEMASEFDRYLEQIWTWVEHDPEYRGTTLLVVTCDHGRGSTLADWNSHSRNVDGADKIWALFVGPGVTRTGESSNAPTAYQKDIAPTILSLVGLEPPSPPIPMVVQTPRP